jgi:hypothetical protein
MNESPDRARSLTLAACLLSLGPGDACPCCGERLSAVAKSEESAASGPSCELALLSEHDPVGGGVLTCLDCGCEVAAEEEPPQAGRRRTFSVAA